MHAAQLDVIETARMEAVDAVLLRRHALAKRLALKALTLRHEVIQTVYAVLNNMSLGADGDHITRVRSPLYWKFGSANVHIVDITHTFNGFHAVLLLELLVCGVRHTLRMFFTSRFHASLS